MSKKTYEMDMTSGNFFIKILKFCLPLMLTGILQLLYNAADLIVVGRFSNVENALGAVGSTGSLISLIVNLFMGLSVGSNVLAARYFASKNENKLSKTVHTSVLVSVISGAVLGIIGIIFARNFLHMMNNYLELSVVYLKIYFIGMPFNMLYNFAASILRGVGDTKRPLIFLFIAGAINVVLNLIFVLIFKMDVDGVAIATVISQIISCILIMACLIKTKEAYGIKLKNLKISKSELLDIIKIGLPAGIQSSIFSISNVLIQSSVNMFGEIAMNGNSAAQSIEGFVYVSMNSVYHASLAFVGQNMGARKYQNINKSMIYSLIVVTMIAVTLGGAIFLVGRPFASIYTKDSASIEVAYIRLHYLCLPYFLCGIMDVMVGVLRGMGVSIVPMIVSIIGVCGFRIGWIFLVFYKVADFSNTMTLNYLYISYPISWILTFVIHFITYLICKKRVIKKQEKLYLVKSI